MRTIVSNLLEDSVRHLRVAVDEATREPQPNVVKKKLFSIRKYGNAEAKSRALKARSKGLASMSQ